MKSGIIFFIVSTITVCVESQSTTPVTAVLPADVLKPLQTLRTDMRLMRISGDWDSKKIGADLQAIGTAIQSKIDTVEIQDQFNKLQARYQALQNGTIDDSAIKQAIHSSFRIVESIFPGAREAMRPNRERSSGQAPTTTAAVTTGSRL